MSEIVNVKEIRAVIDNIFVEQFELKPSELAPEKKLYEDFGLDSLDSIDLVIRFQKEFEAKPSNDELMEIRTLEDVYVLAEKYYAVGK